MQFITTAVQGPGIRCALAAETSDSADDHKRTIDFLGIATCRDAASMLGVSLSKHVAAQGGIAQIALKNPSIGHSSKNGFVEAFGLTGVERAFGEATKLARRQPLAPAAPSSRNFLRLVSGLANCDRSENRGFSTQYANSGHWRLAWRTGQIRLSTHSCSVPVTEGMHNSGHSDMFGGNRISRICKHTGDSGDTCFIFQLV